MERCPSCGTPRALFDQPPCPTGATKGWCSWCMFLSMREKLDPGSALSIRNHLHEATLRPDAAKHHDLLYHGAGAHE